MNIKLYLSLVLVSGVCFNVHSASQDLDMPAVAHEVEELNPTIPPVQISVPLVVPVEVPKMTQAQKDVVVQMVADVEHLESGISPKEMVIEKTKDVLRVIGKHIARTWNWFLNKIGF